MAWSGEARLGQAGPGRARTSGRGLARRGLARLGLARLGVARNEGPLALVGGPSCYNSFLGGKHE